MIDLAPIVAESTIERFITAFVQGIPVGAVFALIAIGFVLTYKTSAIFNLAFGAQAYVAGAAYFELHVRRDWPIWAALIASVGVLSPAIGLILERVLFRRLRNANAAAKLVVTIGLMVAIPEIFNLLVDFKREPSFGAVGIVPGGDTIYQLFGRYPLDRNEVVQILAALGGSVLLAALFRFTPLGLRMRAVVESPRLSELHGVDAERVSAFAWALSSMFAGLAGVLIAPRFATLDPIFFFELVVTAIAAAAFGRLVSLPMALVGGLLLGVLNTELATFLPREGTWAIITENIGPALPFIVLFSVVVFWPAIRRQVDSADPLASVDPPPPSPASLVRRPEITIVARGLGTVIIGLIGFWVFTSANDFWLLLVTQAVIYSIIYLSITLLTGIGGQISLCQATFAAIGALTTMQLADRWDVSVLVGLLMGGLIAAAVGMVVAIPVLRLGGIWLALATLAFALFFDAVMVKFSWVKGLTLQDPDVPRPLIGSIDFGSQKPFLVLCLVMLAIVGLAVVRIRDGTTGRTLRALRGSELAAQSIGISPARARIMVFGVSAAIAGIGGSLLAMERGRVAYEATYTPFAGLFWLVLVVTLGSRTVEGAVQAALAFKIFPEFVLKRGFNLNLWSLDASWQFVLFGLAAISFARHPEGLVENGKRQFTNAAEKLMHRFRRRPPPSLGQTAARDLPTERAPA